MPNDHEHLPTARNVHHVSVTVSDLDTVTKFFQETIGCELLYEKGPFGDPDGDSMTRRLGVHPDAEARLAMLRCGPTMNLELFEWEAPDQESEPPKNSDVGAMHIGLQVDDIEAATEALESDEDVEIMDGPQTNTDGPTAGLRYIFCRTPWGFQLELLEAPEEMPYTEGTDERLFGPAPSWGHRYDE